MWRECRLAIMCPVTNSSSWFRKEMGVKMRKFRLVIVLAALMAVAFLSSAAVSRADDNTAAAAEGDVISIEVSPREQRDTRRMWTRRAMMRAESGDLMTVTPEELAAALEATNFAPVNEEPGFAPGSAPMPGAAAMAQAANPDEWAAAEAVVPGTNAGIPFSGFLGNYYSNYWKTYPYALVGRMHFTLPNGVATHCTATPIGPNTIVTAAHCVFDTATNTWHRYVSFCPAYRNGACPYGQFWWTDAYIPTAYRNASTFANGIRYDVAVVQLANNQSGYGVHQMVGTLGRSWNYPYNQTVRTIGYPAKFYNGQYSWICQSGTVYKGADVMEMGCNSGGGHSGGPWIRGFGSTNHVNNVMSYQALPESLNIMGAARFSNNNIVVVCNAAPGC